MSNNSNQLMKKRFLLSLSSLLVCSSALVGFSGKAFAREVNAGPLWNNNDAIQKCPRICQASGWKWTRHWHTTVWNQQSVCSCGEWNLDLSREEFTRPITKASLWKYRSFKTAILHRGLSPYDAAREVNENVKRLQASNQYEIRLNGGDRVTFTIDGNNHVVKILQVGGHT